LPYSSFIAESLGRAVDWILAQSWTADHGQGHDLVHYAPRTGQMEIWSPEDLSAN